MKRTPLPTILFPPALSDHDVHELLQWLQTLLRTIDGYYADPWPRSDPRQTRLDLWEEDDVPF